MRRIFLSFLQVSFLVSITFLYFSVAQAKGILTPATYLVEIGMKELENGKVPEAIHDFQKALLLDPDNIQAKQELSKLGVDARIQGVKSTSQKLQEFQFKVNELEKDKQEMDQRLQKVQMEEQRLHDLYIVKNLELEVLINRVAALKDLRTQDQKKQLKQIHQVAQYYSDQTKDYKDTVQKQKNTIVNQEIALLMPNERKNINESTIEENLLQLGYRVNQLDPMTQAKMEVQDNLIKAFTEYLELREQRFLEVENNLVFNEIDKAKNEKILIRKMDEIIKLQDNVDRSLIRLNDRDRLIVDKDKEKELLQSELLDTQKLLDDQNQKLLELDQKYNNQDSEAEQL